MGLALLVQLAATSLVSHDLHHWYLSLRPPAGLVSPRAFSGVWALAGCSYGMAAWLIWRQVDPWRLSPRPALRLWGWQVALLALWPSIFFRLHAPGLALVVVALLGLAAAATFRAFWRRNRASGALLLPPYLWLCYAAYLNFGFWWLNLPLR